MKQNLSIFLFIIISYLSPIYCAPEEIKSPKFVDNIIIFNHTKLNAGSIISNRINSI